MRRVPSGCAALPMRVAMIATSVSRGRPSREGTVPYRSGLHDDGYRDAP